MALVIHVTTAIRVTLMTDATGKPPCTCHPDDNPPKPCPRRYAYSECVAAADSLAGLRRAIVEQIKRDYWTLAHVPANELFPDADFYIDRIEANQAWLRKLSEE